MLGDDMETFYHVTFKNRIDGIMEKGIICPDDEDMHIYSSYTRKHLDSIYAFLNLEDALSWYDYQEKLDSKYPKFEGEGDQVIIEFTDDRNLYEFDEHREMRSRFKSAVHKVGFVKPDNIKRVLKYNDIKYSSLRSNIEHIKPYIESEYERLTGKRNNYII